MQPTTPVRGHVVEQLLAKFNEEGGPKRPFNHNRIWCRSQAMGPLHFFVMNNKGKLITQEVKRGEPRKSSHIKPTSLWRPNRKFCQRNTL
jgi:hypothetical protein